MDSLTQIVLGAAVGEAVLGKKVGNRAMLWGGIAGTIPDLDVFVRFFTDPITATELHRGITHSIFFAIVMAPILGYLVSKIHNKRDATRAGWSWLFFWSLVTHPLLDAHTAWGTQLFWPFEERLAYNNIFVVDPIYTLPFLFFLLLAALKKRSDPRRSKFNNYGLYISSTYMLLTFVFKGISINAFESQLSAEHVNYIEMDTKPTPFNSILWNAQVETENGYLMGYYSLFDSKPVTFSHEFPKNHELLDPYKDQKVVQQLIKIAAGWYTVERVSDAELMFYDLRFGQLGFDPDTAPFVWQYSLKIKNGTVNVERSVNSMALGMRDAMGQLWTRIQGN